MGVMSDEVSCVVLCEDQQHSVFVYRLLKLRGVNPRKILLKPASRGVGAGSQYVRERYPSELRAIRAAALDRCCRAENLPQSAPQSLKSACVEFARMKDFLG